MSAITRRGPTCRKAGRSHRLAAPLLASLASVVVAPAATAADGCVVMLCLASADWKSIPQCVDPVRNALADLRRGRSLPRCEMAGASNRAEHAWANAPDYCAPQYTTSSMGESSITYWCAYVGAITVTLNGLTFSRTWWNGAGETVTEFSPAAKTQLGSWDTRFDDDYAAWFTSLPPPASPVESGY